jgi:hypothetical protein
MRAVQGILAQVSSGLVLAIGAPACDEKDALLAQMHYLTQMVEGWLSQTDAEWDAGHPGQEASHG